MSWEVTKALPETKSRGPSRRPRAPKPAAGQRRTAAGGRSSGRGPASQAAGHPRGPRRPAGDLRERARGQLRRAREYRAWIDAEAERTSAQLARQEGITPARVCQILRLCRLAPGVVAAVEADGQGRVPSERELRDVAGLDGADAQLERYRELAAAPTAGAAPKRRRPTPGFQEEFERARRYQAMWESGEFDSLEALGRAEGITGSRVSQLTSLLQLAPDIIEKLDVPVDRAPPGVSKLAIRRLSRVRSVAQQRRLFESLVAGEPLERTV